MKNNIILILFMLAAANAFAQHTTSDFKKLHWLEGKWSRTNAKAGRSGIEQWTKTSEREWMGKGINMKGTDTTFVEQLKLVLKDGSLYYVAIVPENKGEVFFKFTALSDKGFTCENAQHDFPKKIAYQLESNNTMKATISGDGKSVDYLFQKAN